MKNRSKHRQEDEKITVSHALFQEILNAASDAIISLDEKQRIILFNRQAETLFGYRSQEVIGEPHTILIPDRFREAHTEHVKRFETGNITRRHMSGRPELIGLRKNGEKFPVEVTISKAQMEGKRIFTAIVRDITERKRTEETINYLAYYDPLTGLPNRTLLHDRLQQAILARQRENHFVAFILIDLDRFKEINDTMGHQRGDILLRKVGELLKNVLRGPDTVSRMGGDEYGLLLPRLAAMEDVNVVIKKIQKVMEAPLVIEGLPICVEASIGIALCPEHGSNADSLIMRADVAMYTAKRTGSGYAIYAPEQNQYSPRRFALMGELRHAVEQDQLLLHYQPKISLKTGRIMGVEALVRWQHPEYGLVPPDQFIEPAERTGLIHLITRWVLNMGLRQWQAWYQTGLKLSLAVNLSTRCLQDPQLPDSITELIQNYGVVPGSLELEITESAIMDNPRRAKEVMSHLNKIGILFSIDDFGTGYSSLAYLKELPANEIKIDKSFIKGMTEDGNDAAIVRCIIDLGHNLGLRVVAEGVENERAWNKLVAFGCDMAQGYHMSRPLPEGELISWLDQSPWGLENRRGK